MSPAVQRSRNPKPWVSATRAGSSNQPISGPRTACEPVGNPVCPPITLLAPSSNPCIQSQATSPSAFRRKSELPLSAKPNRLNKRKGHLPPWLWLVSNSSSQLLLSNSHIPLQSTSWHLRWAEYQKNLYSCCSKIGSINQCSSTSLCYISLFTGCWNIIITNSQRSIQRSSSWTTN